MAPKIVGPYIVLGTLGKGGVGTVYRARDRRSNEEVALKLLSTGPALEPTVARRLVREFEALAELSHPNVVRVFDAGVFQGYPYLVMELVEGLDLRSYLSVDLAAPRPGRYHDSPSDSAWIPGFDDAQDEESREGEESDDGSDEDELPLRAPPVPRFGMDELLTEADTDQFLAPQGGSHRHGRSALRDYADLAGEPDTDIGPLPDSSSSMDALPFSPAAPPPEEGRGHAPRQGPPLEELNQPERVGRLKDTMLQICEALGYIHAHGLIHRDLKPGNIMVDEDRRVRLMDFGLAKHLADETNVTAAGRVVGTYRYMAPEQAMGERVDGRSDLYSLGVLLYELLAGCPPYDGQSPTDLWQAILEREPVPLSVANPGADDVLSRIAHKLLRKDPYERFQTAEEVFELLISGLTVEPSERYRALLRELYLALRGGGLMLSPLDEERVASWEARGVPLTLALQALREAHAAWLGSGPGPRRRAFALRSAQPFVDGLLKQASLRAGGLLTGTPQAAADPSGASAQPATDQPATDRLAAVAASLASRAARADGASRAAYLAAAAALAGTAPPLDPWEAAAVAQGLAYLKALPRTAQKALVRGAAASAGRRHGVPPSVHRVTLRAFLCEAARSHGALVRPSELP